MDKLSKQQRHVKAAIKQEQSDACISSAEREQARQSANLAAIRSKDTKPERIPCRADGDNRISKEKFVNKVVFYLWNDVFKTYGFRSDIFDKDVDGTEKLSFRDFYKKDGTVDEKTVELFVNNVMKHLPKETAADAVEEVI